MRLHPLCEMFPAMSDEDMSRLVADIKENGLREPIVIFGDMILDGRNRFSACMQAGVEPDFVMYAGDNPLAFVVSKNMSRRHLNESQRAMLGARISSMKEEHAKLSQKVAADVVNVSDRSVRFAQRVIKSGDEDLINKVDRGDIPVSLAAKITDMPEDQRRKVLASTRPDTAIKKVMRENRERELAEAISDLPDVQFGVILADPPWKFATYSEHGMDRSADNHYPTLNTDDICNLDVLSISAPNSVLFLWATAPMLPDAVEVMQTWGFSYKTHFIWVKDRMGTGYWARNQHELLLVGTRGNVPAPAPGTQWPSVIDAPLGAHSSKPELFHELIEELFPNLPKIELNRRGVPRAGWAAWGLEVEEEEYV
jgi:N6-adenosine-specific RNA methylase IME4